jgi:RNA polymerase sigma factor (sigma-70 family)
VASQEECEIRAVVSRCVDADPQAWRGLVERFYPFVGVVAGRILQARGLPCGAGEVEEIAADFFGDLFLRRERTLGAFRTSGPFRAYLAILVANYTRKRAAASSRRIRIDGDAGSIDAEGPQAEPLALSPVLDLEEVERAIARLSPADCMLYQLLYVDGVDAGEAARFLGISRDALYIRKHRFLTRIRSVLGERSEDQTGSPRDRESAGPGALANESTRPRKNRG